MKTACCVRDLSSRELAMMISYELLRCEHRVRVFKGFGRESSRIHLDWFSAVEPHWSLPPPDGSGARIVSDSDVQNLELNGHARVLVASLQQRGRQASGEDALCHLRQCRSYGNAQAACLAGPIQCPPSHSHLNRLIALCCHQICCDSPHLPRR